MTVLKKLFLQKTRKTKVLKTKIPKIVETRTVQKKPIQQWARKWIWIRAVRAKVQMSKMKRKLLKALYLEALKNKNRCSWANWRIPLAAELLLFS